MRFDIKAKVVIRNKKGQIVKVVEKECNSYVKQIISALRILMGFTAGNITNTVGGSVSRAGSDTVLRADGASGSIASGIIIGTGTSAVTINDYKLDTRIEHGVGAGQLQYGTTSFTDVIVVGSTTKFTISRTFINDSGNDITVEEVALKSQNNGTFMLERTLLKFTIKNGESGTVIYTISCTV